MTLIDWREGLGGERGVSERCRRAGAAGAKKGKGRGGGAGGGGARVAGATKRKGDWRD